MPINVSADTRIRLAETLPSVERERAEIASRLSIHLAKQSGDVAAAPSLASRLVHSLIDEARAVVQTGRIANGDATRKVAEQLHGQKQQASMVGDALLPALQDTLGPTMGRQKAGAWSNTFWAVFAPSTSHRSSAA